MATSVTFTPVIVLVFVGVVIVLAAVISMRRNRTTTPQSVNRFRTYRHMTYVPGQFSGQMELDMRLPYRKFKKLYPDSNLSYEQYKKMQMQTAFRRSWSSQQNKRMVR